VNAVAQQMAESFNKVHSAKKQVSASPAPKASGLKDNLLYNSPHNLLSDRAKSIQNMSKVPIDLYCAHTFDTHLITKFA